ncbi:unnamed protein product [Rangifer tarandus platyrhynchus]|uniref:Uncharacterized protein n=1 Tax=Rangifer tarandus platyrhynchus TaxID=3082113 RepID=A0AC59Y1Q1_RANTA
MILMGFVAFARHVGPTRVDAELLSQCWEQASSTAMNYVTFSYGNMRTDILLFQSKKDLYSMKKTYGNKTQVITNTQKEDCLWQNLVKRWHLTFLKKSIAPWFFQCCNKC